MRLFLPLMACLAFVMPGAAQAAPPAPTSPASTSLPSPVLSAILSDPRRDADKPRDEWRHPAETLAFFRVRPGMTVLDYMPSSGWWTRILVPYLGAEGRYVALNPDVRTGSEAQQRMFGNLAQSFPAKAAQWSLATNRIVAFNSDTLPPELAGTVDRALIFREMHNLHRFDWLHRELTAIRSMLKPDGLLGIEQHRARPDAPYSYADGSKGYLREKDVIALVEAHGFELVARSEINANAADPANHPAGVWSLPPTFSQKDVDRSRFAAIGESDRMTLLFRKRP